MIQVRADAAEGAVGTLYALAAQCAAEPCNPSPGAALPRPIGPRGERFDGRALLLANTIIDVVWFLAVAAAVFLLSR
jgi:hypothetical protein